MRFVVFILSLLLMACSRGNSSTEPDRLVRRIEQESKGANWANLTIGQVYYRVDSVALSNQTLLEMKVSECGNDEAQPLNLFPTIEKCDQEKNNYKWRSEAALELPLQQVDPAALKVEYDTIDKKRVWGLIVRCDWDELCFGLGEKDPPDLWANEEEVLLPCKGPAACKRMVKDLAALVGTVRGEKARSDVVDGLAKAAPVHDLTTARERLDQANRLISGGDAEPPELVVAPLGWTLADNRSLHLVLYSCVDTDKNRQAAVADCRTGKFKSERHLADIDPGDLKGFNFRTEKRADETPFVGLCPESGACVALKDILKDAPAIPFKIGCASERDCGVLAKALNDVKAFTEPGGSAQPANPPPKNSIGPGTIPTGNSLFALFQRINVTIASAARTKDRSIFLTSALLAQGEHQLRLHNVICHASSMPDAKAVQDCRAGLLRQTSQWAIIEPSAIDPSSIRIYSPTSPSEHGNALAFRCKLGMNCVMLEDHSRYYPGAALECGGADTCNRLVTDFSSLIDLIAEPVSAGGVGTVH